MNLINLKFSEEGKVTNMARRNIFNSLILALVCAFATQFCNAQVYFEDNFNSDAVYHLWQGTTDPYPYDILPGGDDPWGFFVGNPGSYYLKVKRHPELGDPNNQAIYCGPGNPTYYEWQEQWQTITVGSTSGLTNYVVSFDAEDASLDPENNRNGAASFGAIARCIDTTHYIRARVTATEDANADYTLWLEQIDSNNGDANTSVFVGRRADIAKFPKFALSLKVNGSSVSCRLTAYDRYNPQKKIIKSLSMTTTITAAGPAGIYVHTVKNTTTAAEDPYGTVWIDNFKVSDGLCGELPNGLKSGVDFNNDCMVDFNDLSQVASNWLSIGDPGYAEDFSDVNGVIIDLMQGWKATVDVNVPVNHADYWTAGEANFTDTPGIYIINSPAARCGGLDFNEVADIYVNLPENLGDHYTISGNMLDFMQCLDANQAGGKSPRPTSTRVYFEAQIEPNGLIVHPGWSVELRRYYNSGVKHSWWLQHDDHMLESVYRGSLSAPYLVPFKFIRQGDWVQILVGSNAGNGTSDYPAGSGLDIQYRWQRIWSGYSVYNPLRKQLRLYQWSRDDDQYTTVVTGYFGVHNIVVSYPLNQADTTMDGKVNFSDLAVFARDWLGNLSL
jgi:hypothetical protein